jgi:hypothetical protein
VISGTAATSVQGRPIRYAVVGREDRMTPGALAKIRTNATALRDPTLTDEQAKELEAATPEILWVSANVHGDEESGADAALQVLYELADRNDCVVSTILDRAIVVVLPIQNPDGRELNTRRNAYGFDMNRDWFARTQPETDGKLQVVRQYPPMLYIDAHEFGRTTSSLRTRTPSITRSPIPHTGGSTTSTRPPSRSSSSERRSTSSTVPVRLLRHRVRRHGPH